MSDSGNAAAIALRDDGKNAAISILNVLPADDLQGLVLRLGTMASGGRLVPLQSVSGSQLAGWLVVRLVRAAATASESYKPRGAPHGPLGAAISGAAALLPLASPRDLVRMAVGLLHAISARASDLCADLRKTQSAPADGQSTASHGRESQKSGRKRKRTDESVGQEPSSLQSETDAVLAGSIGLLDCLEGLLLTNGKQGRPTAPGGFDTAAFDALFVLSDSIASIESQQGVRQTSRSKPSSGGGSSSVVGRDVQSVNSLSHRSE